MQLATKTLLTFTTAALLGASASAAITIADDFSFSVDAANSATYATALGLGNDVGQGDLYGADNPITIDTTGFTAAGSDKLVVVLGLHNSAAQVAPVTSLTYGGVSVFSNLVVVDGGNDFSDNFIFYLDNPVTDGDLVIGFDDSSRNIDEVSLALFALNNAAAGTAADATNNGDAVDALAGDFVVGIGQRNNQSNEVTSLDYSSFTLAAGNLKAAVAYKTASSDGATAPTYSNVQYQSLAAFTAVPEPSSLALMGLGGLLIARRRRSA